MQTNIKEDPFIIYSEWFSWLTKNTFYTEKKKNQYQNTLHVLHSFDTVWTAFLKKVNWEIKF